jgi:hypothetical protein
MITLPATMMPAIQKVVGALARLRQNSTKRRSDRRPMHKACSQQCGCRACQSPVEPDKRLHLQESVCASARMSFTHGPRMDH